MASVWVRVVGSYTENRPRKKQHRRTLTASGRDPFDNMGTLVPVDAGATTATFFKGVPEVVIAVDSPLLKMSTAFTGAQFSKVPTTNNVLNYRLMTSSVRGQSTATNVKTSITETTQINQNSGLPTISGILVTVGSSSSSSGLTFSVPLTIAPVNISGNFSTSAMTSPDTSQFMAAAYFTKQKNEFVTIVKASQGPGTMALQNPRLLPAPLDPDLGVGGGGAGPAYALAGSIPLDGTGTTLSNSQTITFASMTQTWTDLFKNVPRFSTLTLVACTDAQPNGQAFSIPYTIRDNDTFPKPDLAPVWKAPQVPDSTISAPQPMLTLAPPSTITDTANTKLQRLNTVLLPAQNFVRITAPVQSTSTVEGRFDNELARVWRTGTQLPGSVYWDITWSAAGSGPRSSSFYVFTTTTGKPGGSLQQYLITTGPA